MFIIRYVVASGLESGFATANRDNARLFGLHGLAEGWVRSWVILRVTEGEPDVEIESSADHLAEEE